MDKIKVKEFMQSRDGRRVRQDKDALHLKLQGIYNWLQSTLVGSSEDIHLHHNFTPLSIKGEEVFLPAEGGYSSSLLLPILTLLTARRGLLIGAPGKGKTTSAILMSLIAGMKWQTVRESIQRGHPQLSITDLLGSPLPKAMMQADQLQDIPVAWRPWIQQPVKIVDEYNRIPTKTQSALLSLLAEGYAEQFGQFIHTGDSAWFLTANDSEGGGTFPVIEALKDRMDVVIPAIPFSLQEGLPLLLQRVESGRLPEDSLPEEHILTDEELSTIRGKITSLPVSRSTMEKVAFVLGQLNFCRMASPRYEQKTKDTLKLVGLRVSEVCSEACPLDKKVHICSQTENGVSPRSLQALLHFSKALAYFAGDKEVGDEHVEALLPYIYHEKLLPNMRSTFWESPEGKKVMMDKVSWIANLWKMGLKHHSSFKSFLKGTEGLSSPSEKHAHIQKLLEKHELSAPLWEATMALLKQNHIQE